MLNTTPFPAWPAAFLVGLSLAALAAQAQPAGKAARPDPLDANASVPALRHASSLSTAPRAGEDKPISWRDANDTVARIGGWRVYTREAQQPDPLPARAAASPPAAKPADALPAPRPGPAGHAGHKSP